MAKPLADQHPIINWFITNPVSANLLMLGILLTGLYMVGFLGAFGQTAKLRLEAFPAVESNTISIITSVNGSTPEDVEKGITNKIEEALQGIQGVEKITSSTTANSSRINLDATDNYDMDKLLDEVKTQVDTISNLPAEVEKILVKKSAWQPSILWVTVHGDVDDRDLKQQANRLKNQLLLNPYIERIDIDGQKNDEITIEVSESKLKEYHLSLTQIANAINNGSIDLSTGSLSTDQGSITLRIKDQAYDQQDYENIILRSLPDGSTIRIGDVATVNDGFVEQDILSEFNGAPSLTLRLKSGKHANVIAADKAATEIVNDFAKTLPSTITATIWNNRVSHVKDRIDLFVRNSSMGVIFVFLLLTLFLNLRLAFWVALGIPISFAGTLMMMRVFDISINLISLFGFILVLGIIVDDAIIIGESIYTHKKRLNNAPEATLRGTSHVSTAATFGVLTTVAAFLPLTQVNGIIGNILGQIGYVVIFCLIFSLIESKLILPSHLNHIHVAIRGQSINNPWVKVQSSVSHGLEILVEKTYLPVLTRALQHRYFALLVFISLFILAIGTIPGGILKFAFSPQVESQEISITVEMNNTVNVDTTMQLARRVANDLRIADQQLMEKAGTDIPNITHIAAFNTSDTRFMVRASLAGAETRTLAAPQIVNAWRNVVGKIPGSKSISYIAQQRFSKADLEIELLSSDLQTQTLVAEQLMKTLNAIDGVKDISSSEDEATNEIRIHLKPEASIYGITRAQLAATIRGAFYGVQAERVQRGNEEVRVMVKYPKSERESLADVYQLRVRTNDGRAIPLSSVADLSFAQSPKKIDHVNSRRAVTIYANVDKDEISNEAAIAMLEQSIFPQIRQQYDVDIHFGGETEQDNKAKASMTLGFIISLVMIYILLAIPLKSYVKPIIIMAVIPFGIIGSILGHLLLGMTLSMMGLFGVIALSGVVVNDSLLLLSTIQQHRNEGMDLYESIHVTGIRRFRPIILTSITTFVGLMPMLFETSFQAQFLIPMAVSLGFGILFATAITLVLVPVLYTIFHDIKHFFIIPIHPNSITTHING